MHCPKSLFQRGELSWPSNGIKYLGVTIPPKLADLAKVNVEPRLNQLEADIDRWAPLYLSLFGKANVLCPVHLNLITFSKPSQLEFHSNILKDLTSFATNFSGTASAPDLIYINYKGQLTRGGWVFLIFCYIIMHLVSDISSTGARLQSKLRPGTALKALYAMCSLPSTLSQQYCLMKRRLIPYLRTWNRFGK